MQIHQPLFLKLKSVSRIFFLALITFTAITANSGCSKDSDPPPATPQTYPIQGLWIGTYTVDQVPAQGQLFASFTVYPDGTLMYKSKGGDGVFYYSKGTWTLTGGTSFSGTMTSFPNPNFQPVTQSFTATFSNTGTLTNAVWNDTNNPNGTLQTGKFQSMVRIN